MAQCRASVVAGACVACIFAPDLKHLLIKLLSNLLHVNMRWEALARRVDHSPKRKRQHCQTCSRSEAAYRSRPSSTACCCVVPTHLTLDQREGDLATYLYQHDEAERSAVLPPAMWHAGVLQLQSAQPCQPWNGIFCAECATSLTSSVRSLRCHAGLRARARGTNYSAHCFGARVRSVAAGIDCGEAPFAPMRAAATKDSAHIRDAGRLAKALR